MRRTRMIQLAALCVLGLTPAARAAVFDFDFLASGQSVAQGSFSFPDADLAQPMVSITDFTRFDFVAGGHTFTPGFDVVGIYQPRTNSFIPSVRPDGFGTLFRSDSPDVDQSFIVDALYTSPCYTQNLCGPDYPPVFIRYDLLTAYEQTPFDTIVITPAALAVPEPGTAALLGMALAGFGLIARSRRPVPRPCPSS